MGADGVGPSTSSLSERRSTAELRALKGEALYYPHPSKELKEPYSIVNKKNLCVKEAANDFATNDLQQEPFFSFS